METCLPWAEEISWVMLESTSLFVEYSRVDLERIPDKISSLSHPIVLSHSVSMSFGPISAILRKSKSLEDQDKALLSFTPRRDTLVS